MSTNNQLDDIGITQQMIAIDKKIKQLNSIIQSIYSEATNLKRYDVFKFKEIQKEIEVYRFKITELENNKRVLLKNRHAFVRKLDFEGITLKKNQLKKQNRSSCLNEINIQKINRYKSEKNLKDKLVMLKISKDENEFEHVKKTNAYQLKKKKITDRSIKMKDLYTMKRKELEEEHEESNRKKILQTKTEKGMAGIRKKQILVSLLGDLVEHSEIISPAPKSEEDQVRQKSADYTSKKAPNCNELDNMLKLQGLYKDDFKLKTDKNLNSLFFVRSAYFGDHDN